MTRLAWLVPVVLSACGRSGPEAMQATGTVEVRELDVSPQVPARVVRVLAEEGQLVRAGDTLVLLTQSTMRADIAQREARV
ncbi:MAG: HlyD family secretion protein, partial [Gemmatimonadota bacterium]|nr:HlyD family secretion protein [Gemmatimonadota bacterium]